MDLTYTVAVHFPFGEDLNGKRNLYPRNLIYMVGSNVTFCCILETIQSVPVAGSIFQIPISNRTYISKPVHLTSPQVNNIWCDDTNGNHVGTSVITGYPPDDQNLACMTRDLRSVECHWELGRETTMEVINKTIYTLNGGVCDFNKCVLIGVPKQVTTWTLTAKNALGVKVLTDTADPKHRVWLKAPSKLSHAAYARNATLTWSLDVGNDTSFQIICQVILNESIYNKSVSDVGRSSIVLVHLQPFTSYTAKVKCGSKEHLYKWSDETQITFSTKEDIPEAVDVWIHHFNQSPYVLWKPLTQQQSHGIITKYEISEARWIKPIELDTLCYEINPGNERNDQNITVSARNSAGLSAPSTIIVPGYPDNDVEISKISSHTGGFEIVWDKYFNSTCGYVVEWFPTYNETQCTVEWTKIPECDHAAYCSWKHGNFKAGVKYTVSVYACIDDKPVLLQRHEGYAKELRPSGIVTNLGSNQNGKKLEVSWDELPVNEQNGFIQGYKVETFHSDSKTNVSTAFTKEPKAHLTLDPGTYTIHVSAFTSGGDGGYATLSVEMKKETGQIIVITVIGCSAATLIFIIISVLCFRKRKWLKKVLYPDIPEPKLAGKWSTKGIYCTQMTEGYMKCEVQEVYSSERSATAESQHGLISSDYPVLPTQHSYHTSNSPVDVSHYPPPWPCAQKLPSIIENPSYNMAFQEPVDVVQIPELTLEMQDGYQPAPNFVQDNVVVKNSSGYKPQSA
ncbi:LIF receptor subunit alpha b isoform X2 [Pseudorasbora parva]|uniref:LIF receptor subunit alpha b isoform X2 n=1 Tax=Pseudorasbora parva TaxID=51549 RepID=UPI00351E524C